MKFFLSIVLLASLTLGTIHENANADSDPVSILAAKCGVKTQSQNPSFQQMNCLLTTAAMDANIPPEVVKAVATQENGSWKQFDGSGQPVISSDGGIGLMQITNQSNYDQEKLKNDVTYNIVAGVQILSSMYDRTDLPKIKGAGRDVIENWYFPVMAYNGTKPVNSPLITLTKLKNTNAYQEKVFAKINEYSFGGDRTLAAFPFQTSDFQYDSNSADNIKFLKTEYILKDPTHKTAYSLKKGDMVAATQADVRLRSIPSTSSSSKVVKYLPKDTALIVTGNFKYDSDATSTHQYVWYPVMTNDKKFVGYISSQYIKPSSAISCAPYQKNQKIYWNGMELKAGQIGRLTVLQNTPLFKLNGTKHVLVRTLKKGEVLRVYAVKPGMYSVDGGYYVNRDSKVKYETPSKVNLDAVKCIASFN